MTKPTFQVIGIWDGDSVSQIIHHKDGNFYLLSAADPNKHGYDNSVRLNPSTINGRRDGIFLTFDEQQFKKDLKHRYTLVPIYRYQSDGIDLSEILRVPESERTLEWLDGYQDAMEEVDYTVTKNDWTEQQPSPIGGSLKG